VKDAHKGGGKRRDQIALVKVDKDGDIGFKKVQPNYTDDQCKRREAAMKAFD